MKICLQTTVDWSNFKIEERVGILDAKGNPFRANWNLQNAIRTGFTLLLDILAL